MTEQQLESDGQGKNPEATRVPAEEIGLPMQQPRDPEEIRQEELWLERLEKAGLLKRSLAFLKRGGPGYLQSALTLGGGTAAASLFAGAAFGYQLLWVAPLSMLLGVVMMSAVAHQTLSTGLRPFPAMKRYAGPFFAYGWAIGALLSSIIWHFAQYSLAGAVIEDMAKISSLPISRSGGGVIVLVWATFVAMLYGKSPLWIRIFERLLKYMVFGIILCFGFVVAKTGIREPRLLFEGFFTFQIPESKNGVSGLSIVIAGLAAAVGVNMLFLYPYSLLARGWGRAHRRLARFDLFAGMFVPYLIATSLMVIATANVLHFGENAAAFSGKSLGPVQAASALAPAIGESFGRVVFDLGILGMAMSSIVLHMLCSGFACSEIFSFPVYSWRYRLACLLPAPGVLGATLWSDMRIWIAVPTTILCGFLLPLAYLGFLKMQRSKAYLGDDLPSGTKGKTWLGAMVLCTLTLITFLAWFTISKGPQFLEDFLK